MSAIRLIVGIILAANVCAAQDEAESKKLNGKWKVVNSQLSGTQIPIGAYKQVIVEIKDGKITFADSGKIFDEIEFEVDTKAKPKAIDYHHVSGLKKGVREQGIYELEDNNLTICLAQQKQKRPAEFSSPKGTGVQLLKLKRVP